MNPKILITGATGTIGSQLVRLFSQRNIPIRAMLHSPEKSKLIEGANVEIVQGDFRNEDCYMALLTGIEKVFLLSPSSPNQVEQETMFINAAKDYGINHIVKLSVAGADSSSDNAIARWHGEIEHHLLHTGMNWTLLRPAYFMQNLMQAMPTIVNEEKLYGAFKDGRLPIVDVLDIATVAFHTLTEEGHTGMTYTITGPEALTFTEVADILSSEFEHTITYIDLPPQDLCNNMIKNGVPQWYAEAMMKMSETISKDLGAQTTTTVTDIGHKKPTRFQAFAQELFMMSRQYQQRAA